MVAGFVTACVQSMSLQGPLIVIAERPDGDLVEALGEAGAFPIIEAKWADAPTAFISVKPAAIVIAEPGAPSSESNARMICLQVATASGPIVPVIARTNPDSDAAVPIALPADADLPVERLIVRLRSAQRVRALHETVLRRIETFGAHGGILPPLPLGDALGDATVMIVGRGPLYPALSVAIGERVGMLGALSVETAARHLNSRDIDGIIVGDGFSQKMIEGFLTVLAQDDRFRPIPVAVIGEIPPEFAGRLPNVDHVARDPARVVSRMVPLVRMHAFEARLKRMLKTLDTEGMFDPETGLLTRDFFLRDLNKAIADAAERGHALSIGRFRLDGEVSERTAIDAARLVTRLTRNIDFACEDDNGAILVAFGRTDLREAHIVARRLAATLKNTVLTPDQHPPAINVTLASLKANDTIDSLLLRVNDSEVVAAE